MQSTSPNEAGQESHKHDNTSETIDSAAMNNLMHTPEMYLEYVLIE